VSADARRVVIVGGGVGGLAAAIRLAAAGHHVELVEQANRLGGKLDAHRREGFTWETGPSLLTLPRTFDELLGLAGTSLAEACRPRRLDPSFRYHFADGSTFATRDRLGGDDGSAAAAEALSPGSGADFTRWHHRARLTWTVAERTFFAGPIEDPRLLVRRMRTPLDLLAIDPLPTLARRAAHTFADPRLAQWAGRYATYAGSSPFRVPATLGCIPHVEQAEGAWYLQGGLATLADALAHAATRLGVRTRLGVAVAHVRTAGEGPERRVTGVGLADGTELDADVVVSDVDAAGLYRHLLPDAERAARVRAAGRSTSGFLLLLGVRDLDGPARAEEEAQLAHHTVWFSSSYAHEFDDLAAGRAPDEPTVYAAIASRSDPGVAPTGHASWSVLVNVPAENDPAAAWPEARAIAYGDHVLRVLARRGLDLRDRLVVREHRTPADLAGRFGAVGGAIYGTSSDGRRAAFTRPANRGPVPGLYLVGGSSHPGGGLPLVALSGRIVAAAVADDLAAGLLPRPALR